ncbi:hypothetical protein MLD38_008155 [Melastoma candidum]|uniref:Uncharacterized protein n=1 Tax=Melastoma candidum TaxID=119954 RepID=A0ACB9RUN4_9MYRT|nr:hypothetical protein MLD38_008155 [Melastoma candidum]
MHESQEYTSLVDECDLPNPSFLHPVDHDLVFHQHRLGLLEHLGIQGLRDSGEPGLVIVDPDSADCGLCSALNAPSDI